VLERYVLPKQSVAELEFAPDRCWWRFAQRFNVRSQQFVPAIRQHGVDSEGVMMRWGLIASWEECRPDAVPPPSITCSEILDSPRHRDPWLNGQRCIVPVAGFYLWRLMPERYRQPYFVQLPDRSVFGVAGVWDCSQGEDEDVIESFSIIGVPAPDRLREVANAGLTMPAILRRKDYAAWLRGSPEQALAAMGSSVPMNLLAYAVSPRINSPGVDDATLIHPVALN
jgi:putative SOS response-associated peptidase YedK